MWKSRFRAATAPALQCIHTQPSQASTVADNSCNPRQEISIWNSDGAINRRKPSVFHAQNTALLGIRDEDLPAFIEGNRNSRIDVHPAKSSLLKIPVNFLLCGRMFCPLFPLHLKTHGLCQLRLIPVKGQKLPRRQMKGGGNMKHVERAVSADAGVLGGKFLRDAVSVLPFHRRNNEPARRDVRLQGVEHPLGFRLGKTFRAVFGKTKGLESRGLAKLEKHEET